MKKLSLSLDALRVDSFQTAEPAEKRTGTVRDGEPARDVYPTFDFTFCTCECPEW